MGLLTDLLLLPVTGPAHGLHFILEQIQAQVEAEQLDEGRVEEELLALSLRHDMGEITEAEYMDQEAALLEQLNAIRAYKEALLEADEANGS
jgi:multidrug efflux pump subunit AcrA (membrane-fusion protein)